MSWAKELRPGKVLPGLFWVVLLLTPGIAHTESADATVKNAAVSQMAVDFKVYPVGSGAERDAIAVLHDAARALGSVPANLQEVEQWSNVLTHALRQRGFPIAAVLMTEADWQAMRNGAKPLFTVYPGRIQEIVLENKTRVADARLYRLVTKALCGGEALDGVCLLQTSRLERTTQLLQDVPGVAIAKAPQFSPGAGVGDIKLILSLEQLGSPWAGDIIADNKGITSTGQLRFGLTVSGNNYFGAGESYALTAMTTNQLMWIGSLTGSVPIFDDGLRATAGISRQQYSLNTGTRVTGVASTAQAGVLYPFARGLDSNIWGGVSYLHSLASTSFDDFDFTTTSRLNSFRFSLRADNGDRPKHLRTDQWAAEVSVTLGHRGDNDLPTDSVTHRNGRYVKVNTDAFRTYALSKRGDLFLSGRINGQLANRNLDPSEKLPVGGATAVRAYRADEGSFDDGAIVNIGLYKRLSVAAGHQLQFGVFNDAAYGRVNHSPWPNWELSYVNVPGVTNTRWLVGYGASVEWLTPIGATVSLSVARPYGFSSTSWMDPGKHPVQFWLSLTWGL